MRVSSPRGGSCGARNSKVRSGRARASRTAGCTSPRVSTPARSSPRPRRRVRTSRVLGWTTGRARCGKAKSKLRRYFWAFFDTRRNFGNLGLQHQLWGFALDIQPAGRYVADPSHPPFYLPGQMFGVPNDRAFAALDACRPDGEACTSGLDCCPGACNPSGICAPPTRECADTDERCELSADCCHSENYCINGFCALVELL